MFGFGSWNCLGNPMVVRGVDLRSRLRGEFMEASASFVLIDPQSISCVNCDREGSTCIWVKVHH
jgi:hypothetical protein